MSHPLRVRGLKRLAPLVAPMMHRVASFTGAWIETDTLNLLAIAGSSRILYGCVD